MRGYISNIFVSKVHSLSKNIVRHWKFVPILIIFLSLLLFLVQIDLQNIIVDAAGEDEVHYTIISPTEVTIDWRGSSDTLSYGTTTSYGQIATAYAPIPTPFSSPGPFWEAKLTGLLPSTEYHYSIGGGPDRTFRTELSKGLSNFTVEAIADVGSSLSYSTVVPIANMIAQDHPNIVLVSGDITYGNSNGQTRVDQHFNDVMIWSSNGTAYMPAWGNHEWDTSTDDLRNYKGRFDFPNPQTSPTCDLPSLPNNCGGEDWYWFDYGNVRFISYPEPYSSGSTTYSQWNSVVTILMDQAQADPDINFIVTWGHRPAYSSGHNSGNTTLKNFLDNLGATHNKYVLNVNGHSHNYERTHPQSGVVHLTVGTGGASLEQDGSCLWLTCIQPSWSAVRYMRHGITKLVFSTTGIQGYFICGPDGSGTNDINDITCNIGDIIDSFSIGSPPPTPTPSPTLTPTPTPFGQGTLTRQVLAGSDDAEQGVSLGSVSLGSSDLEFVMDGSTQQTIGVRFTNITIPQGAIIDNATIEFNADEAQSEVTDLTFYAQNIDNSPTFTTTSGNISSRTKTTSSVAWNNIPAWTVGLKYQTPNFASLVQEVVNRPGWASGNAMAFIVTGTGHRTADSYEGGSTVSPKLIVTYTIDPNAPTPTPSPTPTSTPTPTPTLTPTPTPTPTPLPPGTQITVTSSVSSGSDDAEQLVSTGNMRLTSSDLELTNDGGEQTIGMRFTGVNIPQGASIVSAFIEYIAKETQPDVTNLNFYGQAADNPSAFTSTKFDVSNRPKTGSFVAWSNVTVWTVGVKYQTPNLSSVIQEVVNRSGWISGNALSIIVTGTGHRTAYSYNGSSTNVPKLVVIYQ